MTAPTRYRERLALDEQPHVEVEVFTPSTWGSPGDPQFHIVRYPDLTGIPGCRLDRGVIANALDILSKAGLDQAVLGTIAKTLYQPIPGREYIIDNQILERHFEVLPQTFRVQAWGGVYERPMQKQVALDEQLDEEAANGTRASVP